MLKLARVKFQHGHKSYKSRVLASALARPKDVYSLNKRILEKRKPEDSSGTRPYGKGAAEFLPLNVWPAVSFRTLLGLGTLRAGPTYQEIYSRAKREISAKT